MIDILLSISDHASGRLGVNRLVEERPRMREERK
jgi:hypothetical protein